jgi:2'-5' RNA ligase
MDISAQRSFSSLQCDLPREIADQIYHWGVDNIPSDELDPTEGREKNIHVTVKFGIHTTDPSEVANVLVSQGPIKAKLDQIMIFRADEYDVVVIKVDSPALHKVNALLAKHLECTDTYPTYQPHVTIAYVKKGQGDRYEGREDFKGWEMVFDKALLSGKDYRSTTIPLRGPEPPKKIALPPYSHLSA